jgi:uncharacterized lipoprotein YmbA
MSHGRRPARWACLIAALAPLAGCALTSKAEPLQPVYYSPLGLLPPAEPLPQPARGAVFLDRVHAAEHLRDQLIYRSSPVAYRRRELHRWTEQPERYLRRALARALFERHGLTQSQQADAPRLHAELVAFEELAEEDRVRVEVVVELAVARETPLRLRFVQEKAVAGVADDEERPAAVAEALGVALGALADEAAAKVIAGLK